MTNKQKKQYLNSYRYLLHRSNSIEQEIETIRSRYTGRAITYSDMPGAPSESHDLSDYAAAVSDLVDALNSIRIQMIDSYQRISDSIEMMEDEQEKQLLRLRYLQGYSWKDVAKDMAYSEQRVYQIHGNALIHFKIRVN